MIKKKDNDFSHIILKTQVGRSMVEMLGVLAIIGVLSASALSGYSKAMLKHKMNQFTDDFNYFLANAMSFSISAFTNETLDESSQDVSFVKAAQFLGLLNGSLRLRGNKIYDVFQNFFEFYYVPRQDGHYRVRYQLTNSEHTRRLCEQLLRIGQVYSQNLSQVRVYDYEDGLKSSQAVWGDPSCSENKKCLSKIGIHEMHELCSSCTTKKCYFYFFWN